MTSSLEAPPQVAVDDFSSPEAFLEAIDATIKYFNDGDIVTGTVVKVDRDEVLLDIGYKTEGVIPSKELSIKHDVDPHEVVSVGDEVEALVQQKEDKEGRLILSKKRAQYERAWGTIEKIKEEDGVVTGQVIEVVKGGLILDIGLRGFLPASLVEMRRVRDLQPYVGQELEAKIIELDKNRNNVVLSRRAWLEQTQSEVRQSFLTQLQKGQIRKGVVSSIVNFGAFVDLGGVDGLVHVSELSWKHIDHPSEVVEVGQEVTVEVLSVEMDRERVSLSLKATQEDPWQAFARTAPDRSDRAGQGHQAGAVRCVRPGRGGHRGPGPRLRAGRAPRGDPGAGRPGQRRCDGQDHRHRPGAAPDLAVAEAGQRGCRRHARRSSIRRCTAWPRPTTTRATTSTRTASIRRRASGSKGYEEQRTAWEQQYAEAHARWEAHKKQVEEAESGEATAAAAAASYSSSSSNSGGDGSSTSPSPAAPEGSLASDEALQALREKLTGSAS